MNNRIIIYVEGGNIQAVYSTGQAEVEVIDFDNLSEGMSRVEVYKKIATAVKGLKELY